MNDDIKDDTIKVVSINIEYCASITRGYWQYLTMLWKYFLPHNAKAIRQISELVNREKIDVITFTEIDGGSKRTRGINYLGMFSQLTNLDNKAFFPTHKLWFGMANQGNGIISKYEILDTKNIKLETGWENRYLSITRLKINDTVVTVMTTQLALGKNTRAMELANIIRIINEIEGPIIFTGDLNIRDEKELEVLEHTKLDRVKTNGTFPSWHPLRRLDWIFYSPELELVKGYAIESMRISDHLPLIAEFRLK